MNTATSHEQSKRLLACGVDPDTADMSLIAYPNGQTQVFAGKVIINAGTIINDGEKVAENIDLVGTPAWSLGALLTKVLPNVFEDGNYRHVLTIQYVHGATEDRVWDMR